MNDLAAGNLTSSSVDLSWTATGNDDSSGTAWSYDLRYSASPITDMASFAAATAITGLNAPKPAGQAESITVSGLTAATAYYFALVVTDEAGNASGLSNVVGITTQPPRKIGDANGDGYVNVGDLQAVVTAWGSNDQGGWWNWDPDCDFNNDGYITVGDLQVLVVHWNT